MLRLLISFLLFFVLIPSGRSQTYQDPDPALIEQQKSHIADVFNQASKIQENGSLNKIINQEKEKLNDIPQQMRGLNYHLPDFLDTERNDRYMAKALAAGKQIEQSKKELTNTKALLVLVSLSMSEAQLSALIDEAHQIGAGIAIRGFIDDDFEKTLVKLKQLAGEKSSGLFIDPTLFQRFSVSSVPTFVLPTEPLASCTNKGCPTPEHVKATGSTTFQYFLDLVARTGNDQEKEEAQLWLAKYGDLK
jgi:type-F conjugative transfer system pilin assembly protein TrbC